MQGIEYKKVGAKRVPTPRSASTPENAYWRGFRNINEVKLNGPVNHIDFSPVAPYHFAVSSGTNVVLYSGETRQKIKSFSRFLDIAYSGNFRHDGKLLTAGDEKGNIKVFDVETKTMLRQSQPHSAAVHCVDFQSSTQLLSGSDDKSICLYDIPTNTVVNTYHGHTDYVRCLSTGPASGPSSDLFVSGGFDHCVKLWDLRVEPSHANVQTLATPQAVTSLLQLSTSLLLAASDSSICVFDVTGGGRPLERLSLHAKQVTCLTQYLCPAQGKSRILSASLDGAVRVLDPASFAVVHNFKFPDPVLAVAVSPGNVMAVGTSTGILSTRVRSENAQEEEETPTLRPGALFAKPASRKRTGTAARSEVTPGRAEKLSKWDQHMKRFEYVKALDAVLQSRSVKDIIALVEELHARSDLPIAIRGRSDKELEPLISFVTFYITDPMYTTTLLTVANIILDVYADQVGKSSLMDSQLVKLRRCLDTEIELQKNVFKVQGMLDSVVANSPN